MRHVLIVIATAALAACTSPVATGNAEGGVFMYEGFATPATAFNAAEAHCRQYARSARITFIPAGAGPVSFACL